MFKFKIFNTFQRVNLKKVGMEGSYEFSYNYLSDLFYKL